MTQTQTQTQKPAQRRSRDDGKQHADVVPVPRDDQDTQLIRIESEQIIALARAEPIDYARIRDEMVEVIEAFPIFCQQVMYAKPVGTDDRGQKQYARGLSIRAAEELRRLMGFNRVSASEKILDEFHVEVTATFVDYAKGTVYQDSGVVSKRYKTRQGATVVMSDDRFHNLFVKAEKSRRIREVVLRSLPAGLKMELIEAVDRQLDQLLDEGTTAKIIAQFATKGVTQGHLERHLGKPIGRWVQEDRKILLGIWNTVKDNEVDPNDVFTEPEPESENGAAPTEPKKSRAEQVVEKIKGQAPEPPGDAQADAEDRAEPEAPAAPPDAPEAATEPGTPPAPKEKGPTKAELVEQVDSLAREAVRKSCDVTKVMLQLGSLSMAPEHLEKLTKEKLHRGVDLLEEMIRDAEDAAEQTGA